MVGSVISPANFLVTPFTVMRLLTSYLAAQGRVYLWVSVVDVVDSGALCLSG